MAQRIISETAVRTNAQGRAVQVKVYRDAEWQEFIARLFIDGKAQYAADAHDDDKASIQSTALAMLEHAVHEVAA